MDIKGKGELLNRLWEKTPNVRENKRYHARIMVIRARIGVSLGDFGLSYEGRTPDSTLQYWREKLKESQ